jgi:glycosyltransferase involved in cell wall biosynthesis
MRVWMLTSELLGEVAGGIAGYVDGFAGLLGRAGHEVVVVARSERAGDDEPAPGIRVVRFVPGASDSGRDGETPALSPPPELSRRAAQETAALLERLPPPDVIESQEWAGLPYFLLQRRLTEASPLSAIPVVVHVHGPTFLLRAANGEPRYQLPDYWTGELERFSILAADGVVAPSSFAAREVERHVGRRLGVEVVPLPYAAGEPAPLEPESGELLCVGRLQPLKGVLRLVAACEALWQEGDGFRLTLVGGDTGYGGPGRTVGSFLHERYGKRIDEGRLRLTGRLSRAEVGERLRRAWAVVIPSLWENFPLVGCEAMSLGQVVLASRSGGQAEQVGEDGEAGFLFDWEKPGELGRQLRRVLALSEVERDAIGTAARARIAGMCDPENVLRRRLDHFERVVAGASRRRTFPQLCNSREPAATGARRGTTGSLEEIVLGGGDLAGAVRAVRSELVLLCDKGTVVDPSFVERATHVLASYGNVDFVYAWVRTSTGEVEATWNAELPYLLGYDLVSPPVVARRDALERALGGRPAAPEGLELHDLWIGLVDGGSAGVALPDVLAQAPARPHGAITRDEALARLETVWARHPGAVARHGAELAGLENANGPALAWASPGAVTRDWADRASLPADLRRALADAAELRYVKSSLGWRLLAPLRAAKRSLRR